MGRKNKKKHDFKKTPQQAKEYEYAVQSSNYFPDETTQFSNKMLVGSEDFSASNENINSTAPIKKKSLKYVIIDFFKEHLLSAVLTSIIVAAGGAVFSQHSKIIAIEQRLNYIESRISTIEAEMVDRETFQLKLDGLKNEISSDFLLSTKDINWKIDMLEKELDVITNTK